MKDSIIFYKSFYEVIKELPKEQQTQVYNAIFEYYFNDNEIELSGLSKGIIGIIKPNIDSANRRYLASVENGKKGGAPLGNQNAVKKQPKNNLKTTQKQPRNNLNDNDNVNDNVNVNNNNIIYVEQIINYMNELAGTTFKKTTKKTQSLIKARLNEGFTIEDIKDVIYSKYHEWYKKPIRFQNGIMSDTYYRPDTLFGTKFESYLENYKRNYE